MPPNPGLAGGRVELIGRLRREGARTHPDQATRGVPQTQEPHSGHTRRVLTRPLSGSLETSRLDPAETKTVSVTTPIEKALLVKRWQSAQWQE
jgi:hypothetical protein